MIKITRSITLASILSLDQILVKDTKKLVMLDTHFALLVMRVATLGFSGS